MVTYAFGQPVFEGIDTRAIYDMPAQPSQAYQDALRLITQDIPSGWSGPNPNTDNPITPSYLLTQALNQLSNPAELLSIAKLVAPHLKTASHSDDRTAGAIAAAAGSSETMQKPELFIDQADVVMNQGMREGDPEFMQAVQEYNSGGVDKITNPALRDYFNKYQSFYRSGEMVPGQLDPSGMASLFSSANQRWMDASKPDFLDKVTGAIPQLGMAYLMGGALGGAFSGAEAASSAAGAAEAGAGTLGQQALTYNQLASLAGNPAALAQYAQAGMLPTGLGTIGQLLTRGLSGQEAASSADALGNQMLTAEQVASLSTNPQAASIYLEQGMIPADLVSTAEAIAQSGGYGTGTLGQQALTYDQLASLAGNPEALAQYAQAGMLPLGLGTIGSTIGNIGSGLTSANTLGSLASGAASLYGANLASKSAEQAAAIQKQASDAALAEQKRQFDLGQAAQMPWRMAGESALGEQKNLMGLGEQGAEGQLASLMKAPGTQFRFDTGQKAVERSAAAKGQTFSGSTGKALTEYGQNFATNEYGNRLAQLSSLSGQGQSAASNQAAYGQNYAGNVSNLLTEMGNTGAASNIAQGAAKQSGILGAGQALSNLFNPPKQQPTFKMVNGQWQYG